jgi:hypothetical protein
MARRPILLVATLRAGCTAMGWGLSARRWLAVMCGVSPSRAIPPRLPGGPCHGRPCERVARIIASLPRPCLGEVGCRSAHSGAGPGRQGCHAWRARLDAARAGCMHQPNQAQHGLHRAAGGACAKNLSCAGRCNHPKSVCEKSFPLYRSGTPCAFAQA